MSNEKTINQIMGRCKNFNGTINAKCDAGIEYAGVAVDEEGKKRRYPCFAHDDLPNGCRDQTFQTRDEAEAELAGILARLRRMATARTAIVNHVKKQGFKPVNVGGAMECPICTTGTLRFSFAYNGHCHAHCSTPECVDWME